MSGDVFKKVQSGQPFSMPAATFNAFVEAAVAHQQGQDVASRYETDFRQASIIRVKNETGSDQPRFACLGIDAPIILPSDDETEFSNRVALRGTTPADDDHSDGRFVVLLEPLATNAVGLAFAAGVCPVKLLVEDSDAEDYNFADIKDGTEQLAASAAGPATILWKETVTGGPSVEAWAVIRLGGGSVLDFNKAEMIDDLEQGSGISALAWLLEWENGAWRRTEEQITVHGDKGFRGVLFGATPEVDTGDIADVYYSTESERWYAVIGGWYFHGIIVNADIFEGDPGFVKLDVGAGDDEREITVSCFSPYGTVEVDDLVAVNWNTFSLHWDVMKVAGPIEAGCGLTRFVDPEDPESEELRVNPDDLAGAGLTTSGEGCELEVMPGCGIVVANGVNVESSQLAGKGLTPGSNNCDLDVETGCGLRFFGNALEVDPNDIVGMGLLAGVGDCHLDVDISCGLEFDGNSIKVRPQDIAGAGLEGDLFQPGQCYLQVSFPPNCGLAFSVGDQLVVDMNQMTGPGIKTWTNPQGCVGVQLDYGCGLTMVNNAVEVDTATLAGDGLNDLGGCQMSVLLGCNMEYGPSGEIQPDVASLAGAGLVVDAGGGCDKLKIDCNWIETNCNVGGDDLQAGCGINVNGDTVSVDNSALAGIGLNAGAGCAVDVAIGCGLRFGGGGAIEVDPSSLGSSDIVPTGSGCSLKTYGYNGVKQVVTAIQCDPYDPYACPVAVVESWTFENGLLKSAV